MQCVSSAAAGAEFEFDGFVPFLEPFAVRPHSRLLPPSACGTEILRVRGLNTYILLQRDAMVS